MKDKNINVNHEEREHALLSPSSAKRWMNCPASVAMSLAMSEYAGQNKTNSSAESDEGTMAHEISELLLRLRTEQDDQIKKELKEEARIKIEQAKEKGIYIKDFSEGLKTYGDYILNLIKEKNISAFEFEKKVDCAKYASDCWGTCDFCGYSEKDSVLYICDLKFGIGVQVSAFENPQLMIYAMGALEEYKADKISLQIIQPRLSKIPSVYEISAKDLKEWAERILIPSAEKALSPDAEFSPSLETCRFCPARNRCKARFDKIKKSLSENIKKNEMLLDDDGQQNFYIDLKVVKKEADSIFKSLEADIIKNKENNFLRYNKLNLIPSRASRKINTKLKDEFLGILVAEGYDLDLLAPRSLSVTNLEKTLGKEESKKYERFFIKESKSMKLDEIK